jgi:threonine dehydratase
MTKPILPVSSADIDAAATVIAPFAVRTPLLSSPALDERVGTRVYLKPEMLQRTGSFKFRGAFNKLSSIPMAARGGGENPRHAGDHRDARRRAPVQARTHQGLWRGSRAVRSRP